MAVTSSPLRMRAVPEMPSDDAILCSSDSNMPDSPGERRRRVAPASVPSALGALTDERSIETSDLTSVVSLNGFLPPVEPGPPGIELGGRVARAYSRDASVARGTAALAAGAVATICDLTCRARDRWGAGWRPGVRG